MQLTTEQLRSITNGILEIQEVKGGVCFHRIPRRLRSFYQKTEKFRIRMQCPSGVRLRFFSNTCSIHLGQRYGERAREIFHGSLFVDHKIFAVFGPQTWQEEWHGEIFHQERAEKHMFEIWLQHTCAISSFCLEVDDDSTVAPALQQKLRWLIYGDSITQGMTASLPHTTQIALCASALDADILNLSIGGAVLSSELADVLPEYPWDIATIAYGANDFIDNNPPEILEENACKLISALSQQRAGNPIIVQTPILFLKNISERTETGIYINDYREALARAAKNFSIARLIEGPELLAADPKYFDDSWHPNDKGMAVYAKYLLKEMKEILKYDEASNYE